MNECIVGTTRAFLKICVPPVIPFKNQMAMELLEKGRVRFWTQVEKCTSACQVEYVFNDVIVTQGKVSVKKKVSSGVMSCVLCVHFLQVIGLFASRNTQWTSTRPPASLKCLWTLWRSLMRERSPLTWWTAKLRVQPAWCSLEMVRPQGIFAYLMMLYIWIHQYIKPADAAEVNVHVHWGAAEDNLFFPVCVVLQLTL